VARRPLERERVYLDGGRRTTQLMRDSLGSNRDTVLNRPFAVIALLCACRPGPDQARSPNFSLAAAESVASRYVQYDTGGDWRAADSLVLPCEGDQARDYVAVTKNIHWSPPRTHADTITLTALYDLVGSAWSYDRKRAGQQNWRFKPTLGVDTSVFHIVADSDGRLGIVCGPFASNHQMASRMASIVEQFDDSSRTRWQRVLSAH
jgi:hypothetical protein